jgi:hypothetical protein
LRKSEKIRALAQISMDSPEITHSEAVIDLLGSASDSPPSSHKRSREEQNSEEIEQLAKRRDIELASKSNYFNKRVQVTESLEDDEATEEESEFSIDGQEIPAYFISMIHHMASNLTAQLPSEDQRLLYWTFTSASMRTLASILQDYIDLCVLKPMMDEQIHNKTSRSLNDNRKQAKSRSSKKKSG